jgi:hypothetical protein
MARNRQRVCLESGAKLDINRLLREGEISPGGGVILRLEFGDGSQQEIALTSRPRHFGGKQWYFLCPRTGRSVSVLWRPLGARWFASRQAWGRQVAYESQFQDCIGRAHLGKQRIKTRLIGSLDPDEWDLPPKPKRMRWKTYNRYEQKFDRYEEILDDGCAVLVAKLAGLKIF